MKPILVLTLAFAAASVAHAEDFVFETAGARLVIRPDGVASSLIEKQNGKERIRAGGVAFAAVMKSGHLFPASAADRRAGGLHVTFGNAGVDADYGITTSGDYLIVELTAFHGDGIEEIRLMQLSLSMPNAGGVLGVLWDDEFAVSLMALSEQVDCKVAGPVILASVYPAFPMQGQRVAIVAVPTHQFLDVVRKMERDLRLPSPTLAGNWAKRSEDVRTSYLFTDLTEANADETIRYAKLGGFRYILVYSATWSASLGSYPINTQNFSRGEESLKAVIDKCHAAGLKVGMHMLTSLIWKTDALVRPKPDPRLLKDGEATLAADVNEKGAELAATSALTGFPGAAGYYGRTNDIQIDNEIIQYGKVDGAKLLQCVRGFTGTAPATHKAGAKIYHLAERSNSYLADLKTSLKDVISDRVAGLINRCGFDMIYFDGGELNSADGPAWYWLGPQQMQIWERSKRELLVQGSGMTHWTWHVYSRGTCDDYSAVAVKEHLDYHKIADYWRMYHNNFLPAELGWWGFLADAPEHPATSPDEVEYYAVRMLALDSPVSLETNLKALKANGRTEEMLKLLAGYEQLRLSGAVPKDTRTRLEKGEWHMTQRAEFHPVRYDTERVAIPGQVVVRNEFGDQPLKFRVQVAPGLAAIGDQANIRLLRAEPPVEVRPPDAKAAMPGALAQRVEFGTVSQDQGSAFMVGQTAAGKTAPGKAIDLTSHRALAVQLIVEGQAPGTGQTPVLNIQLEATGKMYRDYYIDLDFSGPKTTILAEPGTSRMLAEFRPAAANYSFKTAMYGFNYASVAAVNLRWMRYPAGSGIRCRVGLVEALEERNAVLQDVTISAGASSIAIPGQMQTGDYAEYWGDQPIRIFDRNGVLSRSVPASHGPVLKAGENRLAVKSSGMGTVKLTSIALGN